MVPAFVQVHGELDLKLVWLLVNEFLIFFNAIFFEFIFDGFFRVNVDVERKTVISVELV